MDDIEGSVGAVDSGSGDGEVGDADGEWACEKGGEDEDGGAAPLGSPLWQLPESPGRQHEQAMPERTQAQRRHLAEPLHRQQRVGGREDEPREVCEEGGWEGEAAALEGLL